MKIEPALCKVFTCEFCQRSSYFTRNMPDQAMYCLTCRCEFCLGLMAFQTTEQGTLHSYCPRCIREGTEPSAATVN